MFFVSEVKIVTCPTNIFKNGKTCGFNTFRKLLVWKIIGYLSNHIMVANLLQIPSLKLYLISIHMNNLFFKLKISSKQRCQNEQKSNSVTECNIK